MAKPLSNNCSEENYALKLLKGLIFTKNTFCQVSLHICFIHAFVNPMLFLVLNKDLRQKALEILCCTVNAEDNYGMYGCMLPPLIPCCINCEPAIDCQLFLDDVGNGSCEAQLEENHSSGKIDIAQK